MASCSRGVSWSERDVQFAAALGICGTDREIVGAGRGTPPPGRDFLVLGHESLGRVVAGAGAG
ncbi:MAG TPA: alcohol dehydrogenase catalytic domain-containing protein, partial [Dactylosporangium sp.]|nr:alcohol dehydrogenase catalytic domain-containing protein [Dactylosporangium sp.]